MMKQTKKCIRLIQWAFCTLVFSLILDSAPSFAANETALSDKPIYSGSKSGNVALALSVEFPTALGSSYTSAYGINNEYLGYFDANKCYSYAINYDAKKGLGLYNTGVDNNNAVLANGSDDPHWITTSKPVGAGDVNNVYSAYIGGSATAKPIGKSSDKVGYYTHTLTFNIPTGTDLNSFSVQFSVAYDDRLVDILVNNSSTGINNSTLNFGGLAVALNKSNSNFVIGTNTLSIKTYNDIGETAIRVDNMLAYVSSANGNYFTPQAAATGHACNTVANGRWSGNFLNWALTQTIDPMRFALSGGYRAIDTKGLTVLEKAWASGQGGTVVDPSIATADLISKSTPFTNLTALKIKIRGLGNQFYFTSTGNNDNPALTGGVQPDTSVTSTPVVTNVYQMAARVEVCKPGLLEENCTLYPNNDYKPTGLIQKNATKLRFAAFGYLNDSNIKRDGGVLRARMASIGPTGDYPEWAADTGQFITNPNAIDANNSGVTNSGVINYLNKFGLTAPGYKTYDPVGELYYAAARYFRNKGNVPSYTLGANNNNTMKDGFPVIEDWTGKDKDPIKLSCDLNFIIGVGDVNTHADANLPGSKLFNSNTEPSMPKEVDDDFGSLSAATNATVNKTDVRTSTNYVGALEGLGNLGQSYTPCCTNGTFFMAGLAYDIHTRDIRPDISGSQTVTTYWLDVLEGGYKNKNQFWLAAKYGGFNVPVNYDPYAAIATPPKTADWDSDNNGDPDNYFRANNPSAIISGLNQVFESMGSKANATSSGFALSTPNVKEGDLSFSAKYSAEFWTGIVTGNNITFDAAGDPIETEKWTTDTMLEDQTSGAGWNEKRVIATAQCSEKDTVVGTSTCTGAAFRYNSLNPSDQTAMSTVGIQTNVGNDAVNFIRGDRSKEGIFRKRNKILGDILNSKITAVGSPNAPYSDIKNPGYQDFKNANAGRPTVAYVGANDGMLHAFNGVTGAEMFAYVPNALFKGPNNTPNDDGLAALAKTTFSHHAYVDSTPVVYDVNFGKDATDWHSLLIGGLGKGGKSYYALDVTNPKAITSEALLASKVQWEFTHKDLGFSYGKPIVVKAGGKWIVILTSGYNNADGFGYFFILEAATGKLLKKINTGTGTEYPTDAGLAHVEAYAADGRDFTADAVYAGDLHGNVWRLDLTGAATDTYPAPIKIAKLMSANNENQPITVSPMIEIDQSTSKRYVFVGTGKLLSDADIATTSTQSFYAILDGTNKAFFNNATLPTIAGGYALTRDDMVNHTNNIKAVTEDATKPMGYYIDFDPGYRVNIPMDSSAGIISFAANNVSGDQCNVSAKYRAYTLSYGSGETVMVQNSSTSQLQYFEGDGAATGVLVYIQPGDTNVSVNISNTGEKPNKTIRTKSGALSFQLLNWRSIPNND